MRVALIVGILVGVVAVPGTQGSRPDPSPDITQRRVRVEGASPVLTVDLVHGTVSVTGHDEPYIELVITRTTTAATAADREEADRDVRLDVVEGPGGVTLCQSLPFRERCDEPTGWRRDVRRRPYRVSFEVAARVPRGARVSAKSVDGATLRLEGLDGVVDARHVNGAIDATALSGGGRLKTVNGDIRLAFPVNPRGPLEAETVNGDVVAQFATGLSADFRIASAFGQVFSEFDVTRLPPLAPVADRRDGHLRYRFDRAFGIRVGPGGPAHRITTLNGDICIVALGR